MVGYRFITEDDTFNFFQRVIEALSLSKKLYGKPKLNTNPLRSVMACVQVVIKKYVSGMELKSV